MRCPGCGHPRDEVWVWSPEQERELRERFGVEQRLCVPCDEVAKSRKRAAAENSAYENTYHVLTNRDDRED